MEIHSPIEHKDEVNNKLGDLTTTPDPSRRLWTDEIHALEYMVQSGHCPPSQLSTMELIITEVMQRTKAELASANPFAQARLVKEVSHQLRLRPSFEQGDLVVEQYIPHLRIWLVCGRFPIDHDLADIIYQLQKGDPRHQTATAHYEARKAEAAANRAAADAASTAHVLAVVNDLSPTRRDQFIAVEEALKSGETITARGDDRAAIERGIALTESAARGGEHEAQQVILRGGRRDNAACDNPGSNPLIR